MLRARRRCVDPSPVAREAPSGTDVVVNVPGTARRPGNVGREPSGGRPGNVALECPGERRERPGNKLRRGIVGLTRRTPRAVVSASRLPRSGSARQGGRQGREDARRRAAHPGSVGDVGQQAADGLPAAVRGHRRLYAGRGERPRRHAALRTEMPDNPRGAPMLVRPARTSVGTFPGTPRDVPGDVIVPGTW